MARPTDDPVVFSSDTNYPAGADPWNGTPTKVDPGAGSTAAGWEPEDLPPAQWLNYILNNLGQWAEHLRLTSPRKMQVSTWRVGGAADAYTSTLYDGAVADDDPNEIVVVGTTGEIQHSEDGGATWTSAKSSGSTLYCVAHASAETEEWIAGGVGGALFSSSNGTTWTSRSLGGGAPYNTYDVRSVVHDGSQYVLVGGNGLVQTSPDGITWTNQSFDSWSGSMYNIAWNGSVFVSVGATGAIQSSPDGSTWTLEANDGTLTDDIYSVVWDGDAGLFLISGQNDLLQTSPDGSTWTDRDDGTYRGVTSGGDGILYSTAGSYSEDGGITWIDGLPYPDGAGLSSLSYSPEWGCFLVVGADAKVYRTPNL